MRVAVVNAVYHGSLKDYIGVYLRRAQSSRRIGREKRIAGPAAEYHYAAFFEVTHRFVADIWFGYLAHLYRGLDSDRHSELLERIRERERIHDRREHSHMVGSSPVHLFAAASAPEIPAADDDRGLDAKVVAFFYASADIRDHRVIKARVLLARERLTA
jgi:hypothetical protein